MNCNSVLQTVVYGEMMQQKRDSMTTNEYNQMSREEFKAFAAAKMKDDDNKKDCGMLSFFAELYKTGIISIGNASPEERIETRELSVVKREKVAIIQRWYISCKRRAATKRTQRAVIAALKQHAIASHRQRIAIRKLCAELAARVHCLNASENEPSLKKRRTGFSKK
jgi:hypothetical protein